MKFIVAMILLFALVVVVLTMLRSGPRVTHVEHRRDDENDPGDRKDGDA